MENSQAGLKSNSILPALDFQELALRGKGQPVKQKHYYWAAALPLAFFFGVSQPGNPNSPPSPWDGRCLDWSYVHKWLLEILAGKLGWGDSSCFAEFLQGEESFSSSFCGVGLNTSSFPHPISVICPSLQATVMLPTCHHLAFSQNALI